MAVSPVFRFPISGQEDGSFLVEVSSHGTRPLDLKLIGSESTAVFVTKVRQRRVAELKASNGQCSDEDWENILTATFVEQRTLPDIEIRAEVQPDGSSTTLSFRKNIQGIIQRLGSIKLEENDKTEISPFDWCVSAIKSREQSTKDLASATAKAESLENDVNELKDHLDELIKAKEEHESELLGKFMDLLNEKKVKIRQQQRLLAAASVDPNKLATIGGSANPQHRKAEASRASKRKAVKEESDMDDDGFDKMDTATTNVDNMSDDSDVQADQESDQGRMMTDNDTPSEAESDAGNYVSPPPSKPKGKEPTARSRPGGGKPAKAPPDSASSQGDEDEDEDEDDPPASRNLPYRKERAAASKPPPKPADDEETESDDDEL